MEVVGKQKEEKANKADMEKVLGLTDELLDEFIVERNEVEEEKHRKIFGMMQREAAFTAAGDDIQRNAIKRIVLVKVKGADSSRRTPR